MARASTGSGGWLAHPTLSRSAAECVHRSAPLEAAWEKGEEDVPIGSPESVQRKEYVFQVLRGDVIGWLRRLWR